LLIGKIRHTISHPAVAWIIKDSSLSRSFSKGSPHSAQKTAALAKQHFFHLAAVSIHC
jgi:hypothetical protein